jgi:hypothetical protein
VVTPSSQPYREPLRATLLRNGTIALAAGALAAWLSGGGLARWPLVSVVMLWPSFGGHWVEIFFLNWLRPRLPEARAVQAAARVIVWFVSGVVLFYLMCLTAQALDVLQRSAWPALWLGGVGFIGVELVAHVGLALRGKPTVYDGRG